MMELLNMWQLILVMALVWMLVELVKKRAESWRPEIGYSKKWNFIVLPLIAWAVAIASLFGLGAALPEAIAVSVGATVQVALFIALLTVFSNGVVKALLPEKIRDSMVTFGDSLKPRAK